MNKSYLRLTLSIFVVLSATVACALPGQGAEPVPIIDTSIRETAIAGTAQAAVEQTAAAQSVGTEAVAGLTGAAVEQLPDGTTKYSDYDAGFEITIPAGWLAVRPNSEEFNAALAKEGAVNSMLHDQMTADQAGYVVTYDRLYSYILRPDIKKDVLFGFSKMVWESDDSTALDSVKMGKLVRDLEASGIIPGFRANVVQLHEDGEIKMVEIGGHWMMSDGQGGTIPFYSMFLFFKPSPTSTVRMTFTFIEDYHESIAADVRSIVESIKLFGK